VGGGLPRFEVWDRGRFDGVRADAAGAAPDAVREAVKPGSYSGSRSGARRRGRVSPAARGEGWVIDGTVGMGGHAEAILSLSASRYGCSAWTSTARRSRGPARAWPRSATASAWRTRAFRDLEGPPPPKASTASARFSGSRVSLLAARAVGRGFSFQGDEPLDMRLDPSAGETAAGLLNRLSEAELAHLLFEYGEEAPRAPDRAGDRPPAAPPPDR